MQNIKYRFFVISLFFIFFINCKKKEPVVGSDLAKGAVQFNYTKNIEVNYNIEEVEYRFSFKEEPFDRIKLPLKKIVVNGTSSLGYLEALNLRDKIVGVSNPNYIYDSILLKKIAGGTIKEIGNQGVVDVEEILRLNPDVFFSYSDPNMVKVHQKLESLGIPVVLINEFKEQNPLAKVEWIKFFGVLFNKESEANVFFNKVESSYNNLKEEFIEKEEKPEVLVDIMYGDVWYLPRNNSFLAQFIHDAGGKYSFTNESSKKLNLSFEKVYKKAKKAKTWINASNVQYLKELEAKNHNYKLFEAFQKGEVYSLMGEVKGEANNYFEEGIVRPDLILKDLTQIFYPFKTTQDLKFYEKLK